jgi:hypothetical protein
MLGLIGKIGSAISTMIPAPLLKILVGAGAGFMVGGPWGALAGGVMAAGSELLKASTADDMISGYGERTLITPKGTYALNDKDHVIAGTQLLRGNDIYSGPKGSISLDNQTNNSTTTNNNTEVVDAISRLGNSINPNVPNYIDTVYDSVKNLNKEVKKTNVDVLKSFGTPAAPKTTVTKTKRPAPGTSILDTMNDLTDAKAGIAAENLAAFNAEVEMLAANVDKLAGSYNGLYTDPAMEAYIANMQTIVGLLADTLTTSFNAALDSGQNFFQALGQALLQLIRRLIIAAAVAALLSFFLGGIGVASSIAGFAPIFKQLSGLDFSQGSATGSMVAMPTNTVGQGNYQIDIMGDKMRLLLNNEAIKNSRVV